MPSRGRPLGVALLSFFFGLGTLPAAFTALALVLGVNLLGDSLNAVLRQDWRTLIGLPIGGAMLAYLFTPGVRGWFRGP